MSPNNVIKPEHLVASSTSRLEKNLTQALPLAMQTGFASPGPSAEVMHVVAAMLAQPAALIDNSEKLFDPIHAPDALLPWLCGWFGWDWLFIDPSDPRKRRSMTDAFPPGTDRLRSLLVAVPSLHRLRGRSEGLLMTLRTATGIQDFSLEQIVERQHLIIQAPVLPSGWTPWLRRLIAMERPVHLTWSLVETAPGETADELN